MRSFVLSQLSLLVSGIIIMVALISVVLIIMGRQRRVLSVNDI